MKGGWRGIYTREMKGELKVNLIEEGVRCRERKKREKRIELSRKKSVN